MRRLKLIDLIDLEGVLGHFTERFTLSAALPLPNTSAGDRPFELVAKADLFPLGGCEQRGYAKWPWSYGREMRPKPRPSKIRP
jgi:hypothetical protein